MASWRNRIIEIREVDAAELRANPDNWRTHPPEQESALRGVLAQVGIVAPLTAYYSQRAGGALTLIDGHLRHGQGGKWTVCILDLTDEEADLILTVFDPLTGMAGTDPERLLRLIQRVEGQHVVDDSIKGLMAKLAEKAAQPPPAPDPDAEAIAARKTLAERFLIPPFSILDARQGYWQERKRAWIALGIQSELGRGGAESYNIHLMEGGAEYPDGATWTRADAAPGGSRWPDSKIGPDGKFARKDLHMGVGKASPGGSPRPSTKLGDDGKTRRGDGAGRPLGGADFADSGAVMPTGSGMSNNLVNTRRRQKDSRAIHDHQWQLDKLAKPQARIDRTQAIQTGEWVNDRIDDGDIEGGMASGQSGTSIFDPVLCECAYTWFTPPDGVILDPFAGGSVRGIVAAYLGRSYVGVDLRPEQIAANEEQAQAIVAGNPPTWIVGNSLRDLPPDPVDFVFSCPPYYDLEVYSDQPEDLSAISTYDEFLTQYREIIAQAVARLKDNRFACFVVGDIRDRAGNYRNFVSDTIAAFRDAGAHLYNEAILVTAVGSLPIRAAKQFEASRKLGKTHQNVLVFVKGDGRLATESCGAVQVADFVASADGDDADPLAQPDPEGMRQVKVSAKMANLKFNGCDPQYIADVCHARCCESSTAPTGIVVTIHPSEQDAIELRGGRVVNGMLQPEPGQRRCPFKTSADLCGLHATPDKPFGCIASPFTLNDNDTLIVRNRYRLLKCYNDGNKIPAYVAFRASLDLIFGAEESERICRHLESGGGDIVGRMPYANWEKLRSNDETKHRALGG